MAHLARMVSVPTIPGTATGRPSSTGLCQSTSRPTSSIGRRRQARPQPKPAPVLEDNTSGARDAATGAKLATFNWPPPPSPASACRPNTSPVKGKGSSGGLLGTSCELDLCLSDAAAVTDKRNREELWAIRADIEREKLRMVAPYPFFGNPMRFSDEFAALQIAEDGRFSFSEMFSEVADLASTSTGSDIRRIVTYEGVFTALLPTAGDDDDPQAAAGKSRQAGSRPGSPAAKARPASRGGRRPGSPTSPAGRRPVSPGMKAKANLSSSVGMGKAKEALAEDTGSEQSGIEATALVKTEMVESGGRSKLVSVERGAFRFALTVSPFFHPTFATVKVLNKTGAPPRRRRLPYIGTGCATMTKSPGSMVKPQSRSSSLTGSSGLTGLSPEMRLGQKYGPGGGGARLKISRSGPLLPSGSVDSPFKCAGSGSFASPQKGFGTRLNFGAGSPQRQSPLDVIY